MTHGRTVNEIVWRRLLIVPHDDGGVPLFCKLHIHVPLSADTDDGELIDVYLTDWRRLWCERGVTPWPQLFAHNAHIRGARNVLRERLSSLDRVTHCRRPDDDGTLSLTFVGVLGATEFTWRTSAHLCQPDEFWTYVMCPLLRTMASMRQHLVTDTPATQQTRLDGVCTEDDALSVFEDVQWQTMYTHANTPVTPACVPPSEVEQCAQSVEPTTPTRTLVSPVETVQHTPTKRKRPLRL